MGYIMDLRQLVGSQPIVMGGANVILLDENERLLLKLRHDNNCWRLPGGTFRTSGSLEEVAKRELYEESGFIAKRLTLFNIFSGEEFYYGYPNGDEVYKFHRDL